MRYHCHCVYFLLEPTWSQLWHFSVTDYVPPLTKPGYVPPLLAKASSSFQGKEEVIFLLRKMLFVLDLSCFSSDFKIRCSPLTFLMV